MVLVGERRQPGRSMQIQFERVGRAMSEEVRACPTKYRLYWSNKTGGTDTTVVDVESQKAATAAALDRLYKDGLGWGYYTAEEVTTDAQD